MAKILILGAGASFGHGAKTDSKPPLIKDFCNDDAIRKIDSAYDVLFKYLDKLNIQGDLEHIYDLLESYSSLQPSNGRVENIERYGKDFEFAKPIDFLRSITIDAILGSTLWLKDKMTCPFHDYLANSWLNSSDLAISFNYDLIFDTSLKKSKRWNEDFGYGSYIPATIGGKFTNAPSELTLLKPHGSLNWFKMKNFEMQNNDTNYILPEKEEFHIIVQKLEEYFEEYSEMPKIVPVTIKLAQMSTLSNEHLLRSLLVIRDDYFESHPNPCIILPSPLKPLNKFRYGFVKHYWEQIETKLQESDEILSIGFSWRDPHFNSFIITCLNKYSKKIKLSIVANEDTKKHIENIFSVLKPNIEIEKLGEKFSEVMQVGKI